MTLIEAKHQVANKYGFHTWAEYKTFMRNTKCTEAKKELAHDEAAELYAEWKVKNLSSNPVLSVSLPELEKLITSRIKDAFDNGYQNYEKNELLNALETIKRLVPPDYFSGNVA